MSSHFVISYNDVDVVIKTTLKQDPEFLGQYLVNKIKKFSRRYHESDIMTFVLDMIKEWQLVSYDINKVNVRNYEWLYTVYFDSKNPKFYVEHANKKSEFKFYLEDGIDDDWVDEVNDWVNGDDDENEKDEDQSESESESESEDDE